MMTGGLDDGGQNTDEFINVVHQGSGSLPIDQFAVFEQFDPVAGFPGLLRCGGHFGGKVWLALSRLRLLDVCPNAGSASQQLSGWNEFIPLLQSAADRDDGQSKRMAFVHYGICLEIIVHSALNTQHSFEAIRFKRSTQRLE